jgi:hypothetical protein
MNVDFVYRIQPLEIRKTEFYTFGVAVSSYIHHVCSHEHILSPTLIEHRIFSNIHRM